MQSGKLDRRVTIMRSGTPVDDGYTTQPGGLTTYATRWAAWKPATRGEQFENAMNKGKAGGFFHLRSDSLTRAILPTDKLEYNGQIYDILGVSELGRNDGVEQLVAVSL